MNPTAPPTFLDRYEPWRRTAEVAFWIVSICLHATFNTVTVWLDIQRVHLDIPAWAPAVWEWSSNLVILALIPAVLAFEQRFPVVSPDWRRTWRAHLAFSVVFSVVHVVGMVTLRKAMYAAFGETYDFGYWPRELFYEYLKDVRGYMGILATVALYRLVLWRLRGEAALLSEPDDGAAVEPVARPERFLVKKLGKEYLLPANDIEWVQAWGNYVNLHVRGRDHPLRSTLTALESRLDPGQFQRVHRSYIVNIAQISAIEPQDGGDAALLLHSGQKVPCSRTYREALRERLG